jgi:hypothetical protein
MSRNKAFWPAEGVRRQVPNLVGGKLMDAEVTNMGIRFFTRNSHVMSHFVTWEQVFMAKTKIFDAEVK